MFIEADLQEPARRRSSHEARSHGRRSRSRCAVHLLVAALPCIALRRRAAAGAAVAAPQTPKAAAPIDLTGYWVSVVTEDWRYRMVTPAKGDYQGVPMTPDARKVADAWDPAKEEARGDQCKSYGAPALMRVPGRLHITWQDDQTLKHGDRRRQADPHFSFRRSGTAAGGAARRCRAIRSAQWEARRGAAAPPDGSMKVTTTNLKAGFLRKNGVPYSENATSPNTTT